MILIQFFLSGIHLDFKHGVFNTGEPVPDFVLSEIHLDFKPVAA